MVNNIEQKTKRATFWSALAEIVAKLIGPAVNMVLARLLTPEAFGMVATITMVISFAELFTDAGFQKYIVQHEFDSQKSLDDNTNVAFWTNLIFSAIACSLIFMFRHHIAALVGNPDLGNAISIASIAIILVAFSSIQMARYRRDMDFRTLFFVRLGTAMIPLVITIPLAALLRNYWALLIGNLAVHLFNAIVLTLKSKWKPRLWFSFVQLKEMFSFSAWSMVESVSVWLTSYVSVFLIGTFMDAYHVGLYKTTLTTINSYMAIITSAITPVLFSALSRCQADESLFMNTYYKFQRIAAMILIPMGAGIFLFSDLVTQILLGKQWMEISEFVGIWGLSCSFTIVLANLTSEIHRAKGNPKLSVCVQIGYLLIIVPTLLLSVGKGFRILYCMRSLINLPIIIVALCGLRFAYHIKIYRSIQNILPTAVCSAGMYLAGSFLKKIHHGIGWDFLIIAACVTMYFVLLFTLFPRYRKEIFSFLKRERAGSAQ